MTCLTPTEQDSQQPPVTGYPLIDDALAELDSLAELSPAEQLIKLTSAQELLAQILATSREVAQQPIPGLTAASTVQQSAAPETNAQQPSTVATPSNNARTPKPGPPKPGPAMRGRDSRS